MTNHIVRRLRSFAKEQKVPLSEVAERIFIKFFEKRINSIMEDLGDARTKVAILESKLKHEKEMKQLVKELMANE